MALGFASVVVILFFSFNLGALLLSKSEAVWDIFRVYLSIALGLACYSYLFTVLGVLNIVSRPSIFAIFGLTQLIVMFKLGPEHLKSCYYGTLRSVQSIWIFIAIFLIFEAFHPFLRSFGNPIVGYDALAYHAYLPWFAITDSHSLRTDQLIPNSGLSLGAQGIFGNYIALFGYRFVNLFNLFFLLSTLHLTYLYSKSVSPMGRVIKSLVVLVMVLTSGRIVVTSPSSDLALMFFCIVLLILMLRITTLKQRFNPAWIFALAGFVTFIKPFSLVVVIILLFHFTYELKLPLFTLVKSLLLGFSVNLSWMLYNYYHSGNPFFPLFQGFFKGIGYGPEVMTNEQDVRRSFEQTFSYIGNKEFDFLNLELGQIQIFFSFGIFALSLFVTMLNFLRRKEQSYLLVYFSISYILLLLYIGPILRYFLFINVIQVFLMFSNWTNKKDLKNQKRNLPQLARAGRLNPIVRLGMTSIICLSVVALSSTRLEYQVKDMDPPRALLPAGLTVNENGFRKVIDFFSTAPLDGSRLALLGEGRAGLFYPKPTLVLPNDRRNPFFNPEILRFDQVQKILINLEIDYLLISTSWGWPANANLDLINEYQQTNQNSLVFVSENWKVYKI
jgi:hypothetical protein